MAAIRGVLCDVDGTLIDSNDAQARAFVQAFLEIGQNVSFEKVRPLIGKGGDKLIPEVSGIAKDTEPFKKLSERRKEIYLQEFVPHLQTTPGAREFLERLRADNIKAVMATSGEDDVEAALKQVGLQEFFEAKASSKDAPQSKPDPDIVQAALERGELRADEAIMLGDTPYDLEAAHKAGLPSIALLTGGWKREELSLAAAVYETPADLLAHFEQALLRK